MWAPEEQVRAAAYAAEGPPAITLFTAVNNRSGAGGHSALMINASQRVIFDPAGTWWHRTVPERHDVLYGITPTMLDFYIDYHARETYRVVAQTVQVSPRVAELALARVQQNGSVPSALCGNAVSGVLQDIPGFESVRGSLFPGRIMASFGDLPGVVTRVYRDDDSKKNDKLLAKQQSVALPAQPSQ